MHVGEERRAADGVGEEGEERDVSWGALRFFFFFFVVTVGDGRGGRCASCSLAEKGDRCHELAEKCRGGTSVEVVTAAEHQTLIPRLIHPSSFPPP